METWNAALQTILLRHQEQRYEQDRRALNAGTSQDPANRAAEIDPVRLAQQLAEYRRKHPSPARMPRPRR